MRFYKTVIVSLLFGLSFTRTYCKEISKPTAAIMKFNARSISDDAIEGIMSAFNSELLGINKYRVVERSQMATILQEQGFQQSGACDGSECAVQIGKLLAVDEIFVGTISKVGRTYSVTVREISVQTGEIIKSVTRNSKEEIDAILIDVMPQIAREFGNENRQKNEILHNKPLTALITLRSNPTGARVSINNNYICTTPCDTNAVLGGHEIEMTKNGFITRRESMKLETSSTISWELTKQSIPTKSKPVADDKNIASTLSAFLPHFQITPIIGIEKPYWSDDASSALSIGGGITIGRVLSTHSTINMGFGISYHWCSITEPSDQIFQSYSAKLSYLQLEIGPQFEYRWQSGVYSAIGLDRTWGISNNISQSETLVVSSLSDPWRITSAIGFDSKIIGRIGFHINAGGGGYSIGNQQSKNSTTSHNDGWRKFLVFNNMIGFDYSMPFQL